MTPKISVLMTVRNGEPYLSEAIESILGQTYQDFELIVVDDGSSDRSLQIVRNFNDSRIKIIELGCSIGRTPALNAGVKETLGKYIAIHDADDISLSQRFEKQITYLEENPEISLLGTRHCYIDTDGKILQEYAVPSFHASLCWKLASNNCIAHSSVMLVAEKLHDIGGYNEDFVYSQDYHLYNQLIQQNERLASLPEYLTHIRLHPQSMFNSIDEKKRIEESLANSSAIMNYFLPYLVKDEAREINMFLRRFKPIETLEQMRKQIAILISLHTTFLNRFDLQNNDIVFIDNELERNLFELFKNFPQNSLHIEQPRKNESQIDKQKTLLQRIFEKVMKRQVTNNA
jgi:glycosyltransferase involved in cell wall biosynthesis